MIDDLKSYIKNNDDLTQNRNANFYNDLEKYLSKSGLDLYLYGCLDYVEDMAESLNSECNEGTWQSLRDSEADNDSHIVICENSCFFTTHELKKYEIIDEALWSVFWYAVEFIENELKLT
jgi:hypothetical protein